MRCMSNRFITSKDAAGLLDVSERRVRQMISSGILTGEKLGRDWLVRADSLAEAQARKTTPGPEPKLPSEPALKTRATKKPAKKAAKK